MRRLRLAVKLAVRQLPYRVRDHVLNRRHATADRRFLITHHAANKPYFYHHFLDWVAREFPEIRARFEWRILPCRIDDWSPYLLHIPWLQDPVEDWSPRAHRWSMALAAECDRRGIPVINRVDRISNSVKSVGARLIAGAGIRTPRITPLGVGASAHETLAGLPLPLLIREDRGHGRPTFVLRRREEISHVPLARYRHPIAVEYIDVRSESDGLYRKYRYLAAGDHGVTRHLMAGRDWEVRPKNQVFDERTRAEELAFLAAPDPNAAALQRARRALGLDVVAFDYSYDREGGLIVWEANPYPDLRFTKNPELRYTFPFLHRSYAAVLRLHLQRAGLEIPPTLEAMVVDPAT
jgi:hypothetical protein